jgi:hypothetical protein
MRGGFLDSLTQGLSDAWNKTKNAASGAYNSASSSSSTSTPAYTPPATAYSPSTPAYTPTQDSTYVPPSGGRKRTKKHRKMRGGFTDNTPTTGLASTASPISDIKTAQPHNWVGGRTKRRRSTRSRKSRK